MANRQVNEDEVTLEVGAPKDGTVAVSARLAGVVIAMDRGDLAKALFRARFVKAVTNGRPGINAASLNQEMLRLAQAHIAAVVEPSASGDPASSGEEVRDSKHSNGGPQAFSLTLRGLHEPRSRGRLIKRAAARDAFLEALAIHDYPAPEPVIEWPEREFAAILDLDYHDVELHQRPADGQLRLLALQIQPRPSMWWRTHGRGLHLAYFAAGAFKADEFAAAAAVSARGLDPTCTVEIKHETRHPHYGRPGHPNAGPVVEETQTDDFNSFLQVMGQSANEELVEQWLSDHGLARGHRYAHEHCLLSPDVTSHGQPVHVGDDGVYCHRCAAQGLSFGGGAPGMMRYASLVGGGYSPALATAVRSFTHWGHAKFIVLHGAGLDGHVARFAYQALLKLVHGAADPRVNSAMHRGAGLVRAKGYWATADLSRPHADKGLDLRLKSLPAVQYLKPGEDGKPDERGLDGEKLGIFQGVDDLAEYGYPEIVPIRGISIFHHWISPADDQIRAVVFPKRLQSDAIRRLRPMYAAENRRMHLAEAEAIIQGHFPGIDFPYLRLLIAARGCAEGGQGQTPIIAVAGPSGASKTTTGKIAAAVVGDEFRQIDFTLDRDKLLRRIYEASQRASFVFVDELIKKAQDRKRSILPQLTGLLNYDHDATVQLLYRGSVDVGYVPAIVLTENQFPQVVRNDRQFGRRSVLVELSHVVDWQQAARTGFYSWRTQSVRNAEAANAILSDVIDRFFPGPDPPVFQEIARALGFNLLNETADSDFDPNADIIALFLAICDRSIPTTRNSTFKGPGWKLVRRDQGDLLSAAWRCVCDDGFEGFETSRRLAEADIGRLLGVQESVAVDILQHGANIGIRFRQGSPQSSSKLLNEQIQADPLVLARYRRATIPDPPAPPPPPTAGPASAQADVHESEGTKDEEII